MNTAILKRVRESVVVYSFIISAMFGVLPNRASTDYPPAIYNEAYSGHWYTTGNGHDFCVIHVMEGYYLGTISYFQQSATQASAHYLVNSDYNSSDGVPAGQITQMVRESYYAWHARCWNKWMFGTEHEGFVSNPAWFTETMYQASALLQKHLCDTWGILKDRNHIIGHNEWQNSTWTTWMAANYPSIDTTCNDHTDPGVYWDWNHFMALINGTVGQSDLTIIGAVTVSPTSVASGGTIRVDWTEKNQGTAASSPAHNTKIYLSTSTYGTTYQIGYYAMYTLGVGASSSYYANIVVPTSIPAGNYYVTAFIDCDQQVSESNENNNIGSSTPTMLTVTANNISVTVQPSISGRSFTVDGNTYTTAQTFSWVSGNSHTIATTSPQSGGTGIQYVWSSWSDGGAMSHTVSPASGTTYTANFTTQYYLTMNYGTGGSSVSPGSGWQSSGAGVAISATPASGYNFSSWAGSGSGSYSGSSQSSSVTMNGPLTETASFTPANISVTVQPNPSGRSFTVDGNTYTTAQTFNWVSGNSHTIATTSPQSGGTGIQYVWSSWSDGGAMSHTVSPTSGTTYTANFTTQYYLTMNAGTGGTVSPSSAWYNSGTGVGISATASGGYAFTSWAGSGSGSYSGSSSSTSVTLNGPITETASFTRASSPTISNPRLAGTTFTLSVPTQVGFNYTLEYKNSFSDANWTAVQTISGTGGTITLTDTGAVGPCRIYRVRVQQ